jgi:hypothetical protein
MARMQEHRSFPSIVAYIVFNEGWGQYETGRVTRLAQSLDASRLFDPASGWVDAPVLTLAFPSSIHFLAGVPCLGFSGCAAAAAPSPDSSSLHLHACCRTLHADTDFQFTLRKDACVQLRGRRLSSIADKETVVACTQVGDFIDMHNYVGPSAPAPTATRAAVLGEFGGAPWAYTSHLPIACYPQMLHACVVRECMFRTWPLHACMHACVLAGPG